MLFVLLVIFTTHTMLQASGLPGGASEVDIKSEHVQTMKNFAEKQFAAGGGDPTSLGDLISAKKQVVAGTLTTLTYKRADGSKCEVKVWDQPWTNKREITQSTCGHKLPQKTKI